MSAQEQAVPVYMLRPDLDSIPAHPLPDGFSCRWYQPGDDRHWTTIWRAAEQWLDIGPALFRKEFGADDSIISQRMFFLCDPDGRPVATSTAWFNKRHGLPYGQVHWVAIIPQFQGRGLGKPLMTITCQRLKELGHPRAYLGTHNVRVSAINLYLAFGFLPEVLDGEQLAIWSKIQPKLKYPIDLRRYGFTGSAAPSRPGVPRSP